MAKCSPAGSTIPGVLFDGICREHGIEHLPTAPRSPTSTGKIERFHRSLRAEFLSDRRPFANLTVAQHALDAWAADCNTARTNHCTWPHPANDAPPRCHWTFAHHRELKNAAQHRLGLTGHGCAVRRAH
jgi:transposase InsO family protein